MYGDPLIFLDGLVSMRQVGPGLIAFLERKEEREMWDVYLHKVFDDISFPEFKEKVMANARKERGMSKQEREREVAKSQNILQNFKPPD